MKPAKIIILILVLTAVAAVSLVIILGSRKNSNLIPQSKPGSVSKPAEVEVNRLQGNIVGIRNLTLSVNISGKTQIFNISQTQDIQAIVSGFPDTGDAVVVQTTKEDLRSGKEILIFVLKNSNIVRSIYILK